MKVTPNEATPFAVTLSAPAPAGGVTVTLTTSDAPKVIVTPASVVIPQGATTPAIQPQVTGVGIGAATITASATGYTSGTGTVTVTAPTMAFTGSPLVIAIGSSGKLTLTLTGGQAPAGGLTVNLRFSDTSKATVQGTVSFAAGATSVTVPVTGVAAGTATITASAPNIASATAAVTVTPPPTVTAGYGANLLQPINVVLTNTSGVTAVNLRITGVTNVTAVAPNVIALRPNVIIPMPYGNLAGGQAAVRSFSFEATAGSIEVPFSFIVTYEADNMPPQTAVINVPFPRSMSFSGSPLAINAGASGKLTLNLLGNQAPAAGLIVNLSSSHPSRTTVPATVSFAPGATNVTVPVTGVAPGSVTITATATVVNFPAIATAAVNVTGTIISPPNTPVRLGQSAPFAVTLSAPAPAGGVTVTLKTSDAPKVIVTPASVVIPQGATVPATQPQVTGAGIGSATITASATSYTSGTGTVTVTAPTMAFTGSPLVIGIGGSGKLTLTLTGGQAPAGGLTVNLRFSDTSIATVPGTVSFAAGATSVTVPVTGVAAGTATITASAPNIASATAAVTITGAINLPANTPVRLGQSAPFAVTLSAPAPAGGVTVMLKTSEDDSKVIVSPASVVIPQGATTPAIQPQVTGVGIGAATITAAATGYTSGTGTVTVTAPTMAFTGSPLVIGIGGSGKLTLTLTGGQAPAGGLTVNLSFSDTSIANVRTRVSFAAGGTNATVQVTGVAAGTATITASAPNIASATASVTVTGTINSPANTPVRLGQSVPFAVTLSAPAPAGGVTVMLKVSDDGSRVIVTPTSVVIPQGATTPARQPQVTGAGIGSVTITASATGYTSGTGTVTVTAPTMAFTGSPLSIVAGGRGNLTLSLLGGQAPADGLTVNLSSSDTSIANVRARVSFAAGATTVTVQVRAIAPGTATITASAPDLASATTNVTVTGTIISPANTPVKLGQSAPFAVTLSAPAPAGGVTVTLKSSDTTKVIVAPASVVIPQGATTPTTRLQVTGAGIGAATITASATGYTSGIGTVTVTAPTMALAFTGSPLVIAVGGVGNLTLNLIGGQVGGGGLAVNLSSSNTSIATVPRMVSFAAGSTSVTVPVTALAPGTTTITASATGIASATATVTMLQSPTVTAAFASRSLERVEVLFTNTSRVTAVNVGITGVTNVEALAPNVIVPRSVFQTAGTLEGGQANIAGVVFEATAGSLSVPFRFTITYQADNMPVRTAVIDVPFLLAMSFAGSPLAINPGTSGNLTLNLTGTQAPGGGGGGGGGLTVNLNSSNTSIATVPRTVSFAAGSTSVTVPVTALAPGTTTITASAPGLASTTASVTVRPPPTVTAIYAVNFLAVIDVHFINTSDETAVNLRLLSVTNVTAPAANVIALSRSFVFPQPLVGILRGRQRFAKGLVFDVTAGSIEVPFSFTITYVADNMPIQTAVIDVPFPRAINLSGSPLAINVGASSNLTLNLTGHQAPEGGLPVNLTSSDPGRATVPPIVTVPADETRVRVPVTGIAPGSVTISANATVRNFPATATAIVNVGGRR